MTYTVIGRCPRNGNLGIGIATYSLAVGATCPWFAPGRGALSTQAFTNPDLGPAGVELLGAGRLPEEVISELRRLDAEFEYRQIGVLDRSGSAAAHSGKRIRQWAGHVIGDGVIAMGNGLAGGGVIEAMAGAFAASESLELAGRLMSTLEAGRDAGGQEPSAGNHLPERSAVLLVYGPGPVALTDLRVDLHDDAVGELRRTFEIYSTYEPYYEQRRRDPGRLQAQEDWTREHFSGEDPNGDPGGNGGG